MILIFKRISPMTLITDIEHFVLPCLEGSFLQRSGKILSIKIQLLKHPSNDERMEFNALVEVEPDSAALRVIRKLNRKPLNGKHINIAQYQFRNRLNDRRCSRYQNLLNRRKAERRRFGLEIHDVTAHKKNHIDNRANIGWSTDISL